MAKQFSANVGLENTSAKKYGVENVNNNPMGIGNVGNTCYIASTVQEWL